MKMKRRSSPPCQSNVSQHQKRSLTSSPLSLGECVVHDWCLQPGGWGDDRRLGYKDSQLETSKGRHKVIDIAGRRRLTGFEVALNAQSGEEGQHHLRNCRSSHLGLFGLDVHGEKALQQRSILRHGPVSLIRKDIELPHGVDVKAPLLFPLVQRTILEK